MLKLYNTLSRKKEVFKPLKDRIVGLYTCGPTVYWYAHIGNLRTYLFEDILKRVLIYNNYRVKHIMNITDVGHLTSDQDTGEDKVEKAAKKEGKTAWQIARFYERAFKKDLKLLNIQKPDNFIRATETINDQIKLIKILEKKGFTYQTSDGIYFNTSKLKNYGRLWPKKIQLKAGARIRMIKEKKNPTDFALWKFSPKNVKRQMEWNSPWGKGFPGWHTECVVMSIKKLGIPFDIHCGGVDHILIHHTNEIAQAEAAYGKLMAKYWLHSEFITVEGRKMAKSLGNIFTLNDLIEKNFNPLAFRYLCLQTHYRSKLNFSWQGLQASQNALNNLYQKIKEIKKGKGKLTSRSISKRSQTYQKKFLNSINDDLNTPRALGTLWQLIEDQKIADQEKYQLILNFDRIFALNLKKIKTIRIPEKIKELAKRREKFRKEGKFKQADEIREKIKSLGYFLEDTEKGTKIKKL